MTDNLENLAIEELAITNPTAYINSNPSPREWTMTPQDIARSLKLTNEDFKNLSVQKTKDSALTTLGKGIGSGITGGFRSIMRTADISSLQSTYSSPNMTRDEADRLLQDAEYTAHFLRKKEMAETAEDIKHEWAYDLGNAVGSMIQFVGLGLATGSTAAIGLAAGVQAKSTLEEGLVDTFIEKTGGIEGYTLKDKAADSLLSTAYGVFTGITEQILGVEKLATGAINGLTKANALSRLARMQGKLGKSALIKYGSRLGQAAIGEGAEEFIQSLGEDAAVALAGYADTLTADEVLKKAFVSAGYGALIGGPVGMGLYRYNRKSIIDRINKWSEEKELGLTEQQVVNMADEMLDSNRSTIVDEIATRAEIKNQYGQAYETLKARLREQIDATGTTPWRKEYKNSITPEQRLAAHNRTQNAIKSFYSWNNLLANTAFDREKKGEIVLPETLVEQNYDANDFSRAINDELSDLRGESVGERFFDKNDPIRQFARKWLESDEQAKAFTEKSKELVKELVAAEKEETELDIPKNDEQLKTEYINTVAMTVTLPAIIQANRAGLPLSEFLDVANMMVINNILHFEPVTDINQLQTMLEQQNDIIAEQNRLAKLNNDDPTTKQKAQRRKAILENAIRGMQMKNGIQTAARTRRKAQADYITAQQLAPEQMGTIDTAVEAQEGQEYVLFGGKRIPVEYQVVELADLQPSHINGTVNPNYSNKELQNRASRGTVQDVADLREKGANITPERLLRGMTSAEGAPITNAQNEVIAGNGRTEIIRVAYENPETAAKYRSALEKAGFSTEGMNQPVLIRKNTTMTPAEQVAAADISNISETSAFDEASQAKRDTQYLKDSETPLDFAAKLPMSERRGLMQNNGKWNKRKVQQRYEDALLSWICGNDTQLFEALVLDRGLSQKVIDVLTANGALLHRLQEAHPETNIRQDIYNALIKMQRATKNNFVEITQELEIDGRDVMIENVFVWGFLFTDGTTNKLILNNYITTLQENHQNVAAGADMFGNTVAPLSNKDAMIQALKQTQEARAQAAADQGKEFEGVFTETGEIKNAELAAAVASYQNQFAANDETTLFQLGYVSGSPFYERPSVAYVLQGGEGAIVHGWGVYLLADQLKNVENYRKKFSRNYVFVRNFPEIKPLNGTGDLDGKEAELFEMFKSHFKSPYNINTIADLLQDDLVPGSPEAKLFLDIQTSKQDSKYVVRKELVQGQAHTIYYTLKAPRNAHPWVKGFIRKVNRIIKERVKTGEDRNVSRVVNELLDYARGGDDFDAFLRDMFDKSEIYNAYSKAFVDKAIQFINARLESDQYGVVELEETAPVFSPWPELSPMDAQRVIENLQEIQTAALTDSTIRPELRSFIDSQRVILLHAILQLEAVVTPTLYAADRNLLNMLITSDQTIDSALKDRPELSDFMRKVLKQARESREDLLKTNTNLGEMDPVAYIGSAMDFMKPEELDQYLSAIYPDITNPANPAAEFMQKTSKTMREEVAKMLKTGRLEVNYKTDNVRLFKDTDATVIDAKAPRILQIMARAMRDVVDKKPFDEIIYSNPETYRGLVGLLGFVDSVAVNPSVENIIRMLLTANNTLHLGNLDNTESWKKISALDRTKTNHTNFLLMLLNDAKQIFDQNRTGPDNAKTDSWMALAHAIQNMEPRTKQIFQDAIVDQEIDTKPKHADLIMEMILRPEWVKHTRGQQLAIEIPENDQLLDQDKTLAEQAAAPILREFMTHAVPEWGLGLLEEINQSKYPEFRKAYNLPQERLRDLIEQASSDLFEDVEDSKATKLAVAYIMQNMTGEGLWRSIANNLPDMSVRLKNGEELGEEKYDLYDPDENKTYSIMGGYYTAELARDVSIWLKDAGIQGITYLGGIDGRGFVIFSDEAMEVLQRIDDEKPIYYQGRRGKPMGWYDPELQALILGKTWNETTLVHEFHHRYLEKIWGIYKQAQAGQKAVNQAWIEETEKLFQILEIDPAQDEITVVQQEKFATMVEAYITGLGVEKPETQAFTDFLNWVPEKYKSILNIGYLDIDGTIKNPVLDEQSVAFFNHWFGNPALPSLPTAPDAQRMVNPTDDRDEIIPSTQKEMNNREKEWGQDSEAQNKADAQLWRAIGENTPTDMRAAVDAEEEKIKEETKLLPDDRTLPEEKKKTLRDRWFKTYQPDARERAAQMARKYLADYPERARELAFADPEIETEYDAPVDRGMLIRAVMETTAKGSEEWYILDNNLAVVKSMSASTLSLSGDISHRAYLDAKREVEEARELKAAVNYAGTRRGAMDKWNSDIRNFISKRVGKIIATEANSDERKLAIKAFIEEAKTKFSGNTTNAILNQLDLTGYTTKSQQAFIKWAEKQIKQAAHAHIDVKEQAELMKASIKAQMAMTEIDSAQQDVNGNFARATAAAKALRHWQFVKDKMKKAYIGKWGKFGLFIDNLFGSYAPSAMLMSLNTLFVANIPSTAINNSIVKKSAQKIYGKNVVDAKTIENEQKRIRQIFNASGINLAQMEKPTSPSVLHGEKYTQQEQSHWYDFVFKTLAWGDNLFRIPTFVDALARIASKNANGNAAKATTLFKEYAQLGNQSDEAKIARKQALAVSNMAVFTQEGILASCLNHIRSEINRMSRGLVGLGPEGYGLGNLLAPFLKTGANVVEMGIRGSIAPVRQITTWLKQMQGKEITDLDKIALKVDWKYFTYTAVAMALFAALSNDDDEWYTEPYQTGRRYDPNKPYDSLKIGNVWVKIDIFGPFAIPIRVAAKAIKQWEDDKLWAIAKGYGFGASEALSDLPLANQITDNSMSYMAKQPGKWATGFLYNQANKLVPAQLKSIARAGSRAIDAELDVSAAGQTIERKFHRNYGFDGEELTTNDIINLFTNRLKWGEE